MSSLATAQGSIQAQSVPRVEESDRRVWDVAFVGLLLYIIIEYTRLPMMFPVLAPLHLGKVAVGITAVGLLIGHQARAVRSGLCRALDASILFFLVAVFMSMLFAFHFKLAWDQFVGAVQWVVIYFLISRVLNNRWRLRVFILVFLLLNFKMAQFVIRMYAYELGLGVSTSQLATQGVGAGSTGFFSNSADLGVALCVALPISGFLIFGEKKKLWKLGLMGFTLAYLGAILLSGSRGAVVGAVGVALFAVVRNPKKIAAVLLVLLLIPGIIYFLPDASKDRFESAIEYEDDKTASHRILLWKAGLRMFADHPLFGVGPFNFALVRYQHYSSDDSHPTVTVAHSIYIETLSELGVFGALAVLAIWIVFFRLNAKTRKLVLASDPQGKKGFYYNLAYSLDLALVGYLVSGAFLSVLYYPHIWVLAGLSVGLHRSFAQAEQDRALREGTAKTNAQLTPSACAP